ncbi:MAG: hypothetical protein HY961_21735 [Ignavibacteriae bacterium]|nr:hypothetical protein [Ignavibacteriota bacterium]
MPLRFLSLLLAVCLAATALSQSQFIFIPGQLALPPLRASLQEPRVGLRKEFATSRLKVDIGASVDMLEFRPGPDSTERMRAGIDFFTYALSTNSEGLRLQIDAVDGYFGGHISYVNDLADDSRLAVRLRLLHVSAHFLDGHYNLATQSWKDGREPIPFTRDFGELVGAYTLGSEIEVQFYGGFSYATLIRPVAIKRVEFLAGFELHSDKITDSVFDNPFNIYLADHLSLRGIPSYIGTNIVEAGVKFGEWNSTGLRIFLSYYNGLDVFSQYYDQRRESWGWGFAFDFW